MDKKRIEEALDDFELTWRLRKLFTKSDSNKTSFKYSKPLQNNFVINEHCQRGACLTKDRVIHEGKIVCRYCLRPGEPCGHYPNTTCTSCDKSNLETV